MALTKDSFGMAFAFRNLAATLTATAVLVFSISGGAATEAAYSFDATPGKLPKTAVPIGYAIELTPDLETLARLPVSKPSISRCASRPRGSTLNAVNTTFGSATIDDGAQRVDVTLDATAETATLTAGPHRLRVAFTARINKFGTGLFTVDYPTDTGIKRLISSKLKPADAPDLFMLGRARLQGDVRADGDGAAPFPGGRVMTARALETIAISADLKAQALSAIDAWIKGRNGTRP